LLIVPYIALAFRRANDSGWSKIPIVFYIVSWILNILGMVGGIGLFLSTGIILSVSTGLIIFIYGLIPSRK
jgi:uncharacterized membrane protein YhaH (DUF805 family)